MSTPAQTVGPFFGFALPWPGGPHVAGDATSGAVWLHGRVLDGDAAPVADALVETWQADPQGRFPNHPGDFRGFGRCPTAADGSWAVRTVKPGPVDGPGGARQAPHITVRVFARGLLNHLVTRAYFADEEHANATDPVLAGVDRHRRATLLAVPSDDGYRFDIRLQGTDETVFFEI